MPARPLLIALGTRPEVVKLAPVIRECRRRALPTVVLATGQHRELLDRAFADMGLTPDEDLHLMQPGQTLAGLSARVLTRIDQAYARHDPAYVLVQGDTTTVAMCALAAFYRHIPVGHVEAGLRSGKRLEPFPEEVNRRLVSIFAEDHFAPTEQAARNLARTEVLDAQVHVVGNTVVDTLYEVRDRVRDTPLRLLAPELAALPAGRHILFTCHRLESVGAPAARIAEGVRRVLERFPDVTCVYPVHPNPAIHGPMHEALDDLHNAWLVGPLPHPAIVKLLMDSVFVVTDSGGMQEEAAAIGCPALVARRANDRPEAAEAGVAVLVGDDPDLIVEHATRLLTDAELRARAARPVTVFGDGQAARRIVDVVERRLRGD